MKLHLVRILVWVVVVWSTTVVWRDDDAELKLSHFNAACGTGALVVVVGRRRVKRKEAVSAGGVSTGEKKDETRRCCDGRDGGSAAVCEGEVMGRHGNWSLRGRRGEPVASFACRQA